jgi:hypothetical protein
MADMARKNPSFPNLVAPLDDEGSVIRSREAASSSREGAGASSGVRPPQQSSTNVRPDSNAPKRGHSSTRPAAPGSLDDRLERKVRLATALMRDLPTSDARVRLLHIAIMRRDESLLDGVLAELNKPPHGG